MCSFKTLQHNRVFYNNSCEEGQFGVDDKFGYSNIRLSIPARVRSPPVTLFSSFFSVSTSLQMLCSLPINLCKCSRWVMHSLLINLWECTQYPAGALHLHQEIASAFARKASEHSVLMTHCLVMV